MSRLKEEKTCKRKKQKIVLRSVRLVSPLYVYGNNGMGMTECQSDRQNATLQPHPLLVAS